MSGVQEKHQDMDHQNQDKESDSKSADTETKQEIPDVQTSHLTPSTSPVRKAWRFFPCCCRRSPSPEPGGPGNKGSVSSPPAHTSGTQSMTAEPAEPAGTSKVPSREKASLKTKSFLHRLFGSSKERHTRYKNKHRSEDVKDGVLNGCTHGEASRPRPSREILKSKNKMKQSCSKTNIKEVIDSEQPTGSETLHSFQECTSTAPHLSTCDIHPTESKKEEADDAASGTWQATNKERDSTNNPRTESKSNSASPIPSHTANSLKSINSQLSTATLSERKPGDGCSLTSPLEQTSQPHVAPLPTSMEKHIKEVIDSEQPTGSETLHSFQECTSTVPHLSTCDIHPTESKEEADDAASGTWQATNKERDSTTNPRTESHSSSASPIPSQTANSLKSLNSQLITATLSGRKSGDGCGLTSPLEQTSQPFVAPLPTSMEKHIKEVIDSEQPTGSETLHSFQECTSTVPHLSICDIHPTESKEEEADDAASGTWQATNKERDSTTNPRAESQSSSASPIPSHTANSLKSLNSQLSTETLSGRKSGDGCSLTSPLEQTSQPHVAPLPTSTEKHIKEVMDSEQPTGSGTLHSFQECTSTVQHLSTCDIHPTESKEEADDAASGTWQATNKERDSTTNPRTESQSSSASPIPSQAANSLKSINSQLISATFSGRKPGDGCSLTSPLEQTSQPLVAPLPTSTEKHIKEVVDSKQPTGSETLHSFQECTSTVPHLSTCDIHPTESKEEADDAASGTWQATNKERDSTTNPRTESQSSSASPIPSQAANSLKSLNSQLSTATLSGRKSGDGCSLTSPLEQTSQPHVAPLPTSTEKHIKEVIDSEQPTGSETLHSFQECASTVPHLSTCDIHPTESKEEEADDAASGTWQATDKERDSTTNPRTETQSSSASPIPPHTANSLKSLNSQLSTETLSGRKSGDGCSRTSPLEQTSQSLVASLPTSTEKHIKEVIDSEQPTGSETLHSFQECTSTVPHLSTCDIHPTESKGEEADDAASGTWQATNKERDSTTNPRTETQSSSASPIPSQAANSLKSLNSQLSTATLSGRKPGDGCSLTSPLEQTGQPLVAPLPPCTERYSTADTLQSVDETSGPTSSGQQDDLSVDNTITLSVTEELVQLKECQEEQEGATADENTQPAEDSSKETVCRPLPPYSEIYNSSYLPYIRQTHQNLPSFQRWQNNQPSQASSARTNLYQMQHPLVEGEQDAVQDRNRTTDTLESANEAQSPRSSRQHDNQNVDETMMSSHIKEQAQKQECQEEQEGATADENTQPAEDSSKETACRPLPPYSEIYNSSYLPYIQQTHQNLPTFQRWQNNQPSQATSARTNFYQSQHLLVEREQATVQERTRTTDRLSANDEAHGRRSSRHHDNRNLDDMLSHIKKPARTQGCEDGQSGATAAQNTQSVEDSSKETACRPPPPYSQRHTRVLYKYDPPFQRRETYQSKQASSARTTFFQRQHPPVEREQATVKEENRPTDPLQSADEASGASSSRRRDYLNVDDTKTFNGIAEQAHMQECEEGQPGTTAEQKTQPVEDSSKETACRPFQPISPRFTRVFEPYTQQRQKYIPPFQRWEPYPPSPVSSARTNLYQRQHPFVEREQDLVRDRNRTSDTLEACDEASGASSSRRQNNLNVDDMKMFEEGQPGTTAAQNTQSVEDSSKETVYITKERSSPTACRLSAGSSSGDEEDKCRICHGGSNSPTNPLLSPCRCSGSLQYVHLGCLKLWIRTKLLTRSHLHLVRVCEVCLGPLTLDPATFDLNEYCRRYRPQVLRWPGQFDERRMRFLIRPRQRRPPPEASDT